MSVSPGAAAVANHPPQAPDLDYSCETNFDPLLKHGTFIDSSCRDSPRSRTPSFNGHGTPSTPFGNPDYFEADTKQITGESQTPAVDTPLVLKIVSDQPEESPVIDSPNWLPPGWVVKNKVRISGSTAGSTDKYYVDPVSGHNFRSRKEVLFFLENGSRRKRPKDNAEGQNTESQVSGKKQKQSGTLKIGNGMKQERRGKKKSEKGKKGGAGFDFDFGNVPVSVTWVLSNAGGDEGWTAFLGDCQVTDVVKQEWDAAFDIATKKR